MTLDWETGALAEGMRCYRAGEFFEAHEHWEAVWLGSAEPDKTFLQALIQVTAAFHHLQKGNAIGAASLMSAALRRLDTYPTEYAGIAVESLRQSLRTWREMLACSGGEPQLAVPMIL